MDSTQQMDLRRGPNGARPDDTYQPSAVRPQPRAITLRQAFRALLFVGLYMAVLVGGILAVGLPGIFKFTAQSLILVVLGGGTAAAILALYIHLIRKHRFSFGDLGFRPLSPRMLHLLWQVPAAILAAACIQGLALAAFGQLGIDTSSAGASKSPLSGIAGMPAPFIVLCVFLAAVLTPLWEEVLFRGALLSGLSLRFRPVLAVLLSAAVFASIHLVVLTFPYLFTLGIALALLRHFHQNLWAPVVLHAVNNALVALVVSTAL